MGAKCLLRFVCHCCKKLAMMHVCVACYRVFIIKADTIRCIVLQLLHVSARSSSLSWRHSNEKDKCMQCNIAYFSVRLCICSAKLYGSRNVEDGKNIKAVLNNKGHSVAQLVK